MKRSRNLLNQKLSSIDYFVRNRNTNNSFEEEIKGHLTEKKSDKRIDSKFIL